MTYAERTNARWTDRREGGNSGLDARHNNEIGIFEIGFTAVSASTSVVSGTMTFVACTF